MQVLLKIQTGELRLMDEADFDNIILCKDINSYEILGYLYKAKRAETQVMPKFMETIEEWEETMTAHIEDAIDREFILFNLLFDLNLFFLCLNSRNSAFNDLNFVAPFCASSPISAIASATPCNT